MNIMQKIKKVFKNINVMALIGLLVAGGLAISFKAPEKKATDVRWAQTPDGVWHMIGNNQYECDLSMNVCTADYPIGQDPNVNSEGGTIVRSDGFALIPTE